jgi:hypothetical protein
LAVTGGAVDSKGNPLFDETGAPLKDSSGNAVKPIGQTLQVAPMPLDGSTPLEYYYTLGNLLAFNNTATNNKCNAQTGAPHFLQLALNFAPNDPTVKGSYDESMAICTGKLSSQEAIYGTATPVGTASANTTGKPAAKATIAPTVEASATP